MPWYRCFVRGENFPGSLATGSAESVGFFTTRWVEVISAEDAELAVVGLLRQDPKLAAPPDTPKPVHAKVYVEEIVPAHHRKNNGSGFCFFPMGDLEAEAACRKLERDANWPKG